MTGQRKALLKPFQLLGIAAGFALFAGLIVLVTIRRPDIALIGAGAVFIISTVVLAMLVLTFQPNPDVPVYLDRSKDPVPSADEPAGPAAPDAEDAGAADGSPHRS